MRCTLELPSILAQTACFGRFEALRQEEKMVEVPGFEPSFPCEAKSLAKADLLVGYTLKKSRLEQPRAG